MIGFYLILIGSTTFFFIYPYWALEGRRSKPPLTVGARQGGPEMLLPYGSMDYLMLMLID